MVDFATGAVSTGDGSGSGPLHLMSRAVFNGARLPGDRCFDYATAGVFTTAINPTSAGLVGQNISYQVAVGEVPITTTTGNGCTLNQQYTEVIGAFLINCTGSGILLSSSNVWAIGCTSDNASADALRISGNDGYVNINILNNALKNSGEDGIRHISTIPSVLFDSWTITGNIIEGNSRNGIGFAIDNNNGADHVYTSLNVSFNICRFNDNEGIKLKCVPPASGGPFITYWGDGLICEGNTSHDNGSYKTYTIASIVDNGGGTILVTTTAAHGMPTNEEVEIQSTVNYNGISLTNTIPSTTSFTVDRTYFGDEFVGTIGTAVLGGSGGANGMRVQGFRSTIAKPAYVIDNVIYNNAAGGGQLQTQQCYRVLFQNNSCSESKTHSLIDAVAMFNDQGNQFCIFRRNKLFDCPGIYGEDASGTGIASWNSADNYIYGNDSWNTKSGFSYGFGSVQRELNNKVMFNTVYNTDNTRGVAAAIQQAGLQTPSANAMWAQYNIFRNVDHYVNVATNQANYGNNNSTFFRISDFVGQTSGVGTDVHTDPNMVSPGSDDFRLSAGSVAINAGPDNLTTANGAGNASTTLIVNEAGWFWASVVAGKTDLIDIGTAYDVVVTEVDHANSTLTLQSPQTWINADKIMLSSLRGPTGTNADVGAHAYTPAPTSVTATPGDTNITIDATPGAGVKTTNIYRSLSTPVTVADILVTNATLPHVDPGLTNGTTYYYALDSTTSAPDNSVLSVEVSAIPSAPGSVFYDDFVGPDGQLLETRPGWSLFGAEGSVQLQVFTNGIAAYNTGAGAGASVYLIDDHGNPDHWSEVTVPAILGREFLYMVLRAQDENNFIAWHIAGSGGAGSRLIKRVAGIETDLVTFQPIAGDLIHAEVEGGFARLFRDTIQIGPDFAVAEFQTNTRQGLISSNGYGNSVWISDYRAAEIVAVAPVLSSPNAIGTSATTATGVVTTDVANGILYYLASLNATETASTIKSANSQAVTATGTQNVTVTGLTQGPTWYVHFVHDDGLESNVASTNGFVTVAPPLVGTNREFKLSIGIDIGL